MFLNGNAIADELPYIQLSLTTVWDASLPGVETYFIYSSRSIGKPSLISIENFGFEANLAYIRDGLLVSLRLIRQDLRLRV